MGDPVKLLMKGEQAIRAACPASTAIPRLRPLSHEMVMVLLSQFPTRMFTVLEVLIDSPALSIQEQMFVTVLRASVNTNITCLDAWEPAHGLPSLFKALEVHLQHQMPQRSSKEDQVRRRAVLMESLSSVETVLGRLLAVRALLLRDVASGIPVSELPFKSMTLVIIGAVTVHAAFLHGLSGQHDVMNQLCRSAIEFLELVPPESARLLHSSALLSSIARSSRLAAAGIAIVDSLT